MLSRLWQHRKVLIGLAAALAAGAVLQFTNTNPAVSQTLALSAAEVQDDPGIDPDSQVWNSVASVNLPLTAQTGTYISGGSVTTIRTQVVHHTGRLYIRVTWPDTTEDDTSTRAEDFADAVAIEFPASGTATIPAICMGQADSAVNIWHWRADSNAGLRDPKDVYRNTLVDGYPSTENLFYTAREAGNPFANPDQGAVQSLYSVAFGELTTLNFQDVTGFGRHTADGWTVVFTREFDTTHPGHAVFGTGKKLDMAFAIWDGNNDERNGRKAVSQLVTLNIAGGPAAKDTGGAIDNLAVAIGLLFAVSVLAVAGAGWAYRYDRSIR